MTDIETLRNNIDYLTEQLNDAKEAGNINLYMALNKSLLATMKEYRDSLKNQPKEPKQTLLEMLASETDESEILKETN